MLRFIARARVPVELLVSRPEKPLILGNFSHLELFKGAKGKA